MVLTNLVRRHGFTLYIRSEQVLRTVLFRCGRASTMSCWGWCGDLETRNAARVKDGSVTIGDIFICPNSDFDGHGVAWCP